MNNNELKAIRLNTSFYNTESLKSFDCGDSRINDYFVNEAIGLDQENIFATTIYVNNNDNIVGFYSTSASLLLIDNRDDGLEKSATRETMTEYSAIKIQYFAVDEQYQNNGVGMSLMRNMIERLILADMKYNIGFKVLYLEALTNAMDFYEYCGFNFLKSWESEQNLKSAIMVMNYEEMCDSVDI